MIGLACPGSELIVVPEAWRIKKLKRIARLQYGESLAASAREEGLVEVFGSNGSVGTHERANSIGPTIIVGRKGSFGKVVFSHHSCFCIDTAYFVDSRFTKANLRWLFYALQTLGLDAISQDTGVPGLSRGAAHEMLLPEPPMSAQSLIADFLDRKTAAIDALIANKQHQIARLGEKRQAFLTRAVTQGVKTHSILKESFVPQLGSIPAHWQVRPLRHHLNFIEQGWSPSCENRPSEEIEWGVLKVGCVNGGMFDPSENKALPPDLSPIEQLEIKPGDVLVSRANTRELLGSAAIVEQTRPRLMLCDKLFRLRYKSEMTDPHFLVLALQANHARWQIERDATGTSDSMQNIGQDTLCRLMLPWPSVEEQRRTASVVMEMSRSLAKIAITIRRQIHLLKEYRKTLITAAVTGQIEIAAQSQEAA